MATEIVVSVVLLFVGIAVLVTIHVCIVGRAFRRGYNNGTVVVQVSTSIRSPSMSQEDIKKLPCFEYKMEEEEEGGNNSSPMECAVCLESYKLGDLCRLLPNCSHSFHAQCIDSWLSKTAICPICRTDANSPQVGDSSEVGVELV